MEHILIAERALGRYLPMTAVVHHINGNPGDNRGCNLVICEDQAYHMLVHARARAAERRRLFGPPKPKRPGGTSIGAIKRWATKSPEERLAIAMKAAETRRLRKRGAA